MSYFCRHWLSLFPRLTSRSTFVRQAANLWQYKELLQQRLATELGGFADRVHLDGLRIPLCGFSHAPQCRTFRGDAMATRQRKSKPTIGTVG